MAEAVLYENPTEPQFPYQLAAMGPRLYQFRDWKASTTPGTGISVHGPDKYPPCSHASTYLNNDCQRRFERLI